MSDFSMHEQSSGYRKRLGARLHIMDRIIIELNPNDIIKGKIARLHHSVRNMLQGSKHDIMMHNTMYMRSHDATTSHDVS